MNPLSSSPPSFLYDISYEDKLAGTIIDINAFKVSLAEIFENKNAKEIVDLLISHPEGKNLLYADFTKVKMYHRECIKGFDNECLEKLTKHCTKLQHLIIPRSEIEGDALKHLENVPELLDLSIEYCQNLETDTLRHLIHTRNLLSLNTSCLPHLNADSLKHLVYTPNLLSLNILCCIRLEKDALKHLANTPKLTSLDVCFLSQLEKDGLKNLRHTPKLTNLKMVRCSFEKDSLKYLVFTPKVEEILCETNMYDMTKAPANLKLGE